MRRHKKRSFTYSPFPREAQLNDQENGRTGRRADGVGQRDGGSSSRQRRSASPGGQLEAGPCALSQPAQYTYSVPGYGATGTNFEQVTATTSLAKDVGQFASSYQPFVSLQIATVRAAPRWS
jgi:hypothetical protein